MKVVVVVPQPPVNIRGCLGTHDGQVLKACPEGGLHVITVRVPLRCYVQRFAEAAEGHEQDGKSS